MATAAQISNSLTAQGLPKPHAVFLSNLLTPPPGRALPPLNSLIATGKHRLLSSDITSANILDHSNLSFPANINDSSVKETILTGHMFVQVLSVEDLSKSRWEQIEAIEAIERGETTRGRELIRVVATEEGENGLAAATQIGGRPGGSQKTNAGPHRLALQDMKGQRVYAIELKAVEQVGMGMSIGSKMMLKEPVVARGVVLLQPEIASVLGGKIEPLHKAWLENRKSDLMAYIRSAED
jgi:RecQ-mediated genome instability protein 1